MRALWVVMALVCAVPASAPAYSIVISGFGFDLEVVNSRDRYSTGRVEFDMSQLLSLQPEEPIQSVTLMLFKTLDPSPRTPGIDLYGYAGDGNNSTPPTGEETLLASDIADGISNEVVQFDVTAFVEGLVSTRERSAGFSVKADTLSPLGTGLIFFGGADGPYPVPLPTLTAEVLPEAGTWALVGLAITSVGIGRLRHRWR